MSAGVHSFLPTIFRQQRVWGCTLSCLLSYHVCIQGLRVEYQLPLVLFLWNQEHIAHEAIHAWLLLGLLPPSPAAFLSLLRLLSEHFKMEDVRSMQDLLVRGGYMCKLDLKDAYVPVSAGQSSTSEIPPISMAGSDILISIQCSTLWASNCTFVFIKLLKPVLAHLRAKGLRLVAYLDDI